MAVYTNVKCGSCRSSLTGGYVPHNAFMPSRLGLPVLVCQHCKTLNKTSHMPWSQFSTYNKIYHWISVIIRSFIFGAIAGFAVVGVVIVWLRILPFELPVLTVIAFVSIIFSLYLMIRSNLRDIKIIEKEWRNFVTELASKPSEMLTAGEKVLLYDLRNKS